MFKFESVYKQFGLKQVVKDLNFSAGKGEVVALLGPNGAGKSTSMKMLTGYLNPTRGKITVCDFDLADQKQEAQKKVGYLPESAPLYLDWTVEEFLLFAARTRRIRDVKSAVDQAMHHCGLKSVRHQIIETLSKGYKQRTCFAQSIVHDPAILVLDEPTDGLDPNQKKVVQDFIHEMKKEKTILVSTHLLNEAQSIADRILIINHGELLHDGDLESLVSRFKSTTSYVYTFKVEDTATIEKHLKELPEVDSVDKMPGAEKGQQFLLTANSSEDDLFLAVANLSVKMEAPISEVYEQKGDLTEMFHQLTIAS